MGPVNGAPEFLYFSWIEDDVMTMVVVMKVMTIVMTDMKLTRILTINWKFMMIANNTYDDINRRCI